MILRVAVSVLFVVHGFVHLRVWWWGMPQAGGFDARHSWLIGDARAISIGLAVTAGLTLMAAGAGYFLDQDWWAYAALTGGTVSILLMVLVFNPWLLLGIALSAAAIGLGARDLAD